MAKVVISDFTGKTDNDQPNEIIIPNAALCEIVIIHDDGTKTTLFVGKEYERVACLCPNNRCVKRLKIQAGRGR